MQTVFVEVVLGPRDGLKRSREVYRDARDPIDGPTGQLESLCRKLSHGRRIRMFADGMYVKPWRKRIDDPLYEAADGQPTPDYV